MAGARPQPKKSPEVKPDDGKKLDQQDLGDVVIVAADLDNNDVKIKVRPVSPPFTDIFLYRPVGEQPFWYSNRESVLLDPVYDVIADKNYLDDNFTIVSSTSVQSREGKYQRVYTIEKKCYSTGRIDYNDKQNEVTLWLISMERTTRRILKETQAIYIQDKPK